MNKLILSQDVMLYDGGRLSAEHVCGVNYSITRRDYGGHEPRWWLNAIGTDRSAIIAVCPFCGCKLEREYQYQRAFGG